MANHVANGRSAEGSSGGSSVIRTKRPNGCARRMNEIVAAWEKEHGPIVPRHAHHDASSQPLSNDNELDDSADNTDGDSTTKRKGRGRAREWDGWGQGKKIIDWDKNCNPIGDNAAKLASQLGNFARNGLWFPLYWTSWDGMEDEVIEIVWKDVKANTNAPDGFKKIFLKKLNKAWKSFKYELKRKYFVPFQDIPERLAIVPPDVQPDQWVELVSYWSMESTKEVAMRNMDNRCNLNAYPRIGRNSIPNIVDKRKKNNEPVDGISIWRATRAKKGKYTDEDGAAGIEQQLQRRLDELPEEEQDDPEKRERIFVDVIGNDGHGRVLCGGTGTRLGYTSSATSTGASPLSTQDIEAIEAELAKLREEIAERDRRDLERDSEIVALKAQAAERDSEVAALRAIVQVVQQSSMDAETRIIRLLHNAGINTSLVFASNPSPGPSSGHGSNSRNQT